MHTINLKNCPAKIPVFICIYIYLIKKNAIFYIYGILFNQICLDEGLYPIFTNVNIYIYNFLFYIIYIFVFEKSVNDTWPKCVRAPDKTHLGLVVVVVILIVLSFENVGNGLLIESDLHSISVKMAPQYQHIERKMR